MKAAHQKPYTMFSYAVFFFICDCFSVSVLSMLLLLQLLLMVCCVSQSICLLRVCMAIMCVLTRLLFTVCLSVSCYSCAQMIWIAIAGIYIYAVFMCFLVLFFFLSKQHIVRDELNDKKKQRMREKKTWALSARRVIPLQLRPALKNELLGER